MSGQELNDLVQKSHSNDPNVCLDAQFLSLCLKCPLILLLYHNNCRKTFNCCGAKKYTYNTHMALIQNQLNKSRRIEANQKYMGLQVQESRSLGAQKSRSPGVYGHKLSSSQTLKLSHFHTLTHSHSQTQTLLHSLNITLPQYHTLKL